MATSRTRILALVAAASIVSATLTAMWVSVIEDRQACSNRELTVAAFDYQAEVFGRVSSQPTTPEEREQRADALRAYRDDLHQFLDPIIEDC